MTISGPYCFVCGGHNVVRRRVWGITAWTEQGTRYGWIERDICLDCQRSEAMNSIPHEQKYNTGGQG